MAQSEQSKKRMNPFNTMFAKCTLMVFICVVSVVGTISLLEGRSKGEMVNATLGERASEVTGLLALQLSGAMRFGNQQAIEQSLTDVISAAEPDAIGGFVVAANGSELFATENERFDVSAARELAQSVLETGAPATAANGLMTAVPSLFGDTADVAGVVVTGWSNENQLAQLQASRERSLAIGVGVMLISLIVTGAFLRAQMSKPLSRIESVMDRVAKADYDVDVPYVKRGDEMGKMARRLDTFRMALADAKNAELESAFKSAAFEGSSAPMMVVDSDLKLIFVNPSCEALLQNISDEILRDWKGLDPDAPLGADLSDFTSLSREVDDISKRGAAALPLARTIRIGDASFEVKLNAALGRDREMIGAVIQWSDRTQSGRNAALLGAIDENQIRLEFLDGGEFDGANENGLAVLGSIANSTDRLQLGDVFDGETSGRFTSSSLVDAVLSGQAVKGKFLIKSHNADAESSILDGGFAAVSDPAGRVERIIFLGTDVSEAEHASQLAQEEQERIAAEQVHVVTELGVALKNLAEGDLTKTLVASFPQEYEQLRSDFNDALVSLQQAVGAVTQNADSIRNETREITSAADDLSRRTEKQAATLEETAAALDELTSSVRSAAEGADAAAKISDDAQSNAEKGGDVARLAVEAMDGIKSSSQEISKITSVIDDIAFQTNLLALNAGVEAARAGEAGRGFAVVATEVRALAQRSSDAAREINELISSSGDQVQQGVMLVDQTGEALSAIVDSVAEISERVATIAASAREQSTGLNEINTAVNELDSVTQQNAAMFEETTAASHALTSEADALVAAVARFRLNNAGARSSPVGKPEPNGSRKDNAPFPVQPSPPVKAAGNAALAENLETELDAGWEEF